MKHYGSKIRKFLTVFGFGIILLYLWSQGCKRYPKFEDSNMVLLEQMSQNSSLSQDIRDRAQQAMTNYTNNKLDPEPHLLFAWLFEDSLGPERNELDIGVIDEDNDLLGFGLKEELRDPNGAVNILEEEYPALVHYQGLATVNVYSIPFFTRTREHRKNEKIWIDYLAIDFDAQMKQTELPHSSGDWFADMEEYSIRTYELWRDSLPPVWVSIPDPNRLTVWAYIYDKAGHKSNSVKLIKYTETNQQSVRLNVKK